MSNQNVPELRLDGFEGEWERQNVASISKLVTRVTPSSTAPVMMISAASGFIPQSNKYSSDNAGKSLRKYIELHQDELAYNHGASKLRQFGSCFKLDVPAARVPFVYHCFQVLEDDPTFVGFSLNRDSVQEQLRRLVSSGARMDGLLNISFEQYGTVEVSLPPTLEEQQAIGVVFTNLDAAIDQHTDKHRVLQRTKTALMQKMFPQDGHTQPDLRLDGFEGEWVSKPINSVAEIHNGRDYKHLKQGPIPVYGTGGYMRSVNEALSYSHDAVGIGRKGTINKPYILKAPFWTVDTLFYVTPRNNTDLHFLHASMIQVDWLSKNTATGLPSLTGSAVMSTEAIFPPTLEEQQAIGAVFTKLDTLISAEAQRIEKLTQTKTALLQKMFV